MTDDDDILHRICALVDKATMPKQPSMSPQRIRAIEAIREWKGLTNRELAMIAEVSKTTIVEARHYLDENGI